MGERTDRMVVATAVANVVGHRDTAGNLIAALQSGLNGRRADLCLVFASAHFEDELETLVGHINESLRPRALMGTTGEAVVSGGCEYEHQPAISVWASHLPHVHLASFHVSDESELSRLSDLSDFRDYLGVPGDAQANFLLAADPYTFGRGAVEFLERLNDAYPGRPALGGFASAADQPGQNIVIFDGELLRHGLTGVGLWGDFELEIVVSQGCRPIGKHFVITKAEQNIIRQLGGRSPLEVVHEVLNALPARDRKLVSRGLLVGRVVNEYQPSFSRGDFLIRTPIGIDSDNGALAVDEIVRAGQTIQFHVRDGDSADEDLRSLLSRPRQGPFAGALLFTCNGRGTRLFNDRNHDARLVSDAVGAAPIAGMFCAGEIGPIGPRNFLHGHAAAIGLLRQPEEK
ncbi:MAG: FIST C-terminal domain-containing protein [Planctomycetes bacterium]|nr:FIST C-terminal domain-containing protein [Planctomycetota bacterium]